MGLFLSALAMVQTINPTISTYHQCVQTFALNNIHQAENAETLTIAGEENCTQELREVRESIEREIWQTPSVRDALRTMHRDEVTPVVNENIARRLSEAQQLTRRSVMRDVIFARQRIREMEQR